MPYLQLTWICSCWPVGKPFPVSSFPTLRSKTICHMVYVNYRSQIIHMILRQTESHCETNGFELPILGPRAMWTNPPEKLEWFKNPPHVRAWSHPWTHLRLTLIDIDWQWSLMVYATMLTAYCGTSAPSVPVSTSRIGNFELDTKSPKATSLVRTTTTRLGCPTFQSSRRAKTGLLLWSSMDTLPDASNRIQQDTTGSTWNDWEISIQIHSFRLLLETGNRNMIFFEDATTCSQSYSIERREQRLKNV